MIDQAKVRIVYCLFVRCGGRCISAEYTDKVGELAKSYGLQLHIDGARIFNASVVSFLLCLLSVFIFILIEKVEYVLQPC